MYRLTWLCFVALAGTVGLWGSIHALPPGGAPSLFLMIAVGVGCLALTSTKDDGPTWRQATRLGIDWGLAIVASVGLIALLGFSGLAVVMMLVLLSPTVMSAARRYLTSRASEPGPAAEAWELGGALPAIGRNHGIGADGEASPATETSPLRAFWMESPLQSMDDPTLCFAWRISYVALQRPLSLSSRLRLVDRRQEFLDELERRHPRGFSAWLESGARAAGDPTRYLSHEERRTDH